MSPSSSLIKAEAKAAAGHQRANSSTTANRKSSKLKLKFQVRPEARRGFATPQLDLISYLAKSTNSPQTTPRARHRNWFWLGLALCLLVICLARDCVASAASLSPPGNQQHRRHSSAPSQPDSRRSLIPAPSKDQEDLMLSSSSSEFEEQDDSLASGVPEEIDLPRVSQSRSQTTSAGDMGELGGEQVGRATIAAGGDSADDESADDSREVPERNLFLDQHNSRLKAMQDLFERRQLNNVAGHARAAASNNHFSNHQPMQSSQELSPISIGLDPNSPFGMVPFPMGPPGDAAGPPAPMAHAKPPMAASNDNLDQGLGPALPFGLNPLPHLMGFQSNNFEGPQRGDQSAHSNHHAAVPAAASGDSAGEPSQKVWPKIFRFTDGRINLSDFEKQKKIRLSNKNQLNGGDNYIESAPIMFDGRQLKRKSFLILHGGIFSR